MWVWEMLTRFHWPVCNLCCPLQLQNQFSLFIVVDGMHELVLTLLSSLFIMDIIINIEDSEPEGSLVVHSYIAGVAFSGSSAHRVLCVFHFHTLNVLEYYHLSSLIFCIQALFLLIDPFGNSISIGRKDVSCFACVFAFVCCWSDLFSVCKWTHNHISKLWSRSQLKSVFSVVEYSSAHQTVLGITCLIQFLSVMWWIEWFLVAVVVATWCWVWFGLVWFGLVWFGLVWFGLVCPLIHPDELLYRLYWWRFAHGNCSPHHLTRFDFVNYSACNHDHGVTCDKNCDGDE